MLEPTNRILNQLMTHTSIFFSTSRRLTSRSVISPTAFFFLGPQSSFYRQNFCLRASGSSSARLAASRSDRRVASKKYSSPSRFINERRSFHSCPHPLICKEKVDDCVVFAPFGGIRRKISGGCLENFSHLSDHYLKLSNLLNCNNS